MNSTLPKVGTLILLLNWILIGQPNGLPQEKTLPMTRDMNNDFLDRLGLNNKTIVLQTVGGEAAQITFVSLDRYNRLKKEPATKFIEEIRTIAGIIPVYLIENKSYLLGYSSLYGIIVENSHMYDALRRTKDHDIISIIIDNKNGKIYPSFEMYSSGVKKLIENNQYERIEGFGRKLHMSLDTESKVIWFEDGSILTFFERAPDVFQGGWCPDFETFYTCMKMILFDYPLIQKM
ncbi:MAG: hypothetical protein R3C61_15585 [Bacteroidia bacterium]